MLFKFPHLIYVMAPSKMRLFYMGAQKRRR